MTPAPLFRIFLDLDHTLLSARTIPAHVVSRLPLSIRHFPSVPIRGKTNAGGGEEENHCIRSVTLRPYAAAFLSHLKCLPCTRLSIFTANEEAYAHAVVSHCINTVLEPRHQIDLATDVFSRKHCTEGGNSSTCGVHDEPLAGDMSPTEEAVNQEGDNDGGPAFRFLQKDIETIQKREEAVTGQGGDEGSSYAILVDDTIRSFVPAQFQSGSGLLVTPFHGNRRWRAEDEADRELIDNVLPVLTEICNKLIATHSDEEDAPKRTKRRSEIVDLLDRYHAPVIDKILAVLQED